MDTNIPIWLSVLKHFDENGYFHNGLTIPFLLGASEIVSPNESLTTINEFIFEDKTIVYLIKFH